MNSTETVGLVLHTVSQEPRGLLALSGGAAILSGIRAIQASRVPDAVYSWFWRNGNEEVQPSRWGMALAGVSSICLGSCAVAIAVFGFNDSKPAPAVFQENSYQNREEEKSSSKTNVDCLDFMKQPQCSSLYIPESGPNLEFRGHQKAPSLNDCSPVILMQYGLPRNPSNLGPSELPKFQVWSRFRYNPLVFNADLNRCEPMEPTYLQAETFSYLFNPGYHAYNISPIAESRSHEFETLFNAAGHPIHGSTFRELGENLYYKDPTRTFPQTMIQTERCDEAASLADLFYSRFLDKYRCYGVDETNAVNYEFISKCGYHQSHVRAMMGCGDRVDGVGRKCDFFHYVHVCKGQLRPPHERGFCFPDSLIAIHELMHAEELEMSWLKGSKTSEEEKIYHFVREIMPVTKSIILADEIAKKLDGIDVADEKDYEQKNYSIHGCTIPLGKYANFYRELEKEEKSLGLALVSEKSIRFLTCARGLIQKPE